MSTPEGFFVDWNGHIRTTTDPGGGYLCDVDTVARYVGVTTKTGTLVHEATFYKDMAAIEKAGIKAKLVPGSHPWGNPDD
ncbi:hypothetical protein [Aquabacterium sp.]|jgi:hypothetical protein|uniref:hypothetical protein n=1 Tax=Aquabacterium sp. TaxID=1872578 RepID=UPI0025BC4C1C|nr:hypothetical protein [Aquabacterium sp.]